MSLSSSEFAKRQLLQSVYYFPIHTIMKIHYLREKTHFEIEILVWRFWLAVKPKVDYHISHLQKEWFKYIEYKTRTVTLNMKKKVSFYKPSECTSMGIPHLYADACAACPLCKPLCDAIVIKWAVYLDSSDMKWDFI